MKPKPRVYLRARSPLLARIPLYLFCALALFAMPRAAEASEKSYQTGSLIVPMDGTHQTNIPKAYGLVFDLLSRGVPVDWAINRAKSYEGVDLEAPTAIDGVSPAVRQYRGGPFVISSEHRPAAIGIIQAWRAMHGVKVHEATEAFSADIGRELVAAPTIAILATGDGDETNRPETIPLRYLSAAGIPSSAVQVLNLADTASLGVPGAASNRDGALFAGGERRFCTLVVPHWSASSDQQRQIVAEVSEFLRAKGMLVASCAAIETFENTQEGAFLTTQGVAEVRDRDGSFTHHHSSHPVAQSVGAYVHVGGAYAAWKLPAGRYRGDEGSEYFRVTRKGADDVSSDIIVTGSAHGERSSGRVTYIAGHDHLGVNNNGLRYFFNALLFSPCTGVSEGTHAGGGAGDAVANVDAVIEGPTSPRSGRTLTYSLRVTETGGGVAADARLTVQLPAGVTVLDSGGGVHTANQIVWDLGTVGDQERAVPISLQFQISVPGVNEYTVAATLRYRRGVTQVIEEPVTFTVTVSDDIDGDGTANNGDPDDDNDGLSDEDELACGSDPERSTSMAPDQDSDGRPDCVDPDIDGDGQTNTDERQCGSDPDDAASVSLDFDNDDAPDCVDSDDDNDGVGDGDDAFPLDPTESVDTDGDRIGNNADPDDDGDGQTDLDEVACGSQPLDRTSTSPDFDGDTVPDCADADDDNDTTPDAADAFPLDPTESVDTDGDRIGNNADPDDDNDGQTDADEAKCGSDPLSASSKSLDSDGNGRPDCVDPLSAVQLLRLLIKQVDEMNLRKSPDTRLQHDLQKALVELEQKRPPRACSWINKFISDVVKERGRSLTPTEADDLLDRARRITAMLGC
jgi:hypothetical protein